MKNFSTTTAARRRDLGRCLTLAGLLAAAPFAALAQTGAVGIGTTTPDASAALDVSSTSKGLLPPRLSQTQRDAIARPAAGLTIFNTTTGVVSTWDGVKWVAALADTTPVATTFAYTGAPQTYTVPAGVTSLQVDLAGAAGGAIYTNAGQSTGTGQGLGGRVQATLAVTPGQVLTINVGQAGDNSFGRAYNGGGRGGNGGSGGGGASDVCSGGTALGNRLLVAGGGGGGGTALAGGAGGGLIASIGGGGGTQTGGGYGANVGSSGSGGDGIGNPGAGGGGYYGGGSGSGFVGAGGGSSYAGPGTSLVAHTQGYQAGNGYVSLSPAAYASSPAPFLDGSNIAGVIKNQTTQQAGASFNIGGNGIVGGSVGIGTTAPTQKLDVDGQLRVRGLSGTDTRVPVVLPDGTLGVSAPPFATPATATTYALAATSAVATGSSPAGVAVSSTIAYVVNQGSNTLQTFNVSNPASPVLLATVATGSGAYSVAVSGTTAYVVNQGSNTLQTFNVSNPASPVLLGSVATDNYPYNVAVSGTTAYVVNFRGNTLQAFNVSNPASPVLLGSVATGSSPWSVAVSGTTAYVVNGSNTLQTFGVSNPASPVLLATVATGSNPNNVAVSGTTAYVVNFYGNTLQAFNVSDPASPGLLATVATGNFPISVAVSGPTAYVVNALSNTLQALTIQLPARVVAVNADGTLGSVPLLSGADFIQNGTTPQPTADFNVSGAGTVGGLLTAGSATVSGSVGIGTASPAQKLEVVGNASVQGNSYVSGNVGIGTTAPTQKLDVAGNTNISGNGSIGGNLGIGTSSPAARLQVAGVALVSGNGAVPSTTNAAGLGWNALYPGRGESEFYNYCGGGSGGFRFFSVGGTAAPTASNQVAQISGSTGAYSTLSDRRVKTNIAPLAQGLRTVLALRPVSYDFHPSRRLENGVVTFLPDDQPVRALGFVAQDLYQVVPEAVEKPADERQGFYTVSYTTLVPVLTQAIQEQQTQIEELKQQNAALQARAATAEANASSAKAEAAQATATLETFETRLRRLEAAGGQAQR